MKITSLRLKNFFIQFIFSQNPWLLLMEVFFLWLVNNPRFKTAQSNMNQNVHGSMNQSVATLEVWWVLNINSGLGNTRKSLNCLLSNRDYFLRTKQNVQEKLTTTRYGTNQILTSCTTSRQNIKYLFFTGPDVISGKNNCPELLNGRGDCWLVNSATNSSKVL